MQVKIEVKLSQVIDKPYRQTIEVAEVGRSFNRSMAAKEMKAEFISQLNEIRLEVCAEFDKLIAKEAEEKLAEPKAE